MESTANLNGDELLSEVASKNSSHLNTDDRPARRAESDEERAAWVKAYAVWRDADPGARW